MDTKKEALTAKSTSASSGTIAVRHLTVGGKFTNYIIHIICTLGFCTSILAQSLPAPPQGGFVQDNAKILSGSTIEETNLISNQLWQNEKIALYTVTFPATLASTIDRQGIEKTTRDLFDYWELNSKDRNYGILLGISPSNRKARIEFGKDWNHRFDAEAEEIMNTILVPAFKSGNYDQGVLQGVEALNHLARGLGLPPHKNPPWVLPALIIGGIIIAATIISLFRSGKSGWGWAILAGIGILIFFLLRTSKKGGNPLGGGSSGGGGASGSW